MREGYAAIINDIRLVCDAAETWVDEYGPFLSTRVDGVIVKGPRVDEAIDRLRAFVEQARSHNNVSAPPDQESHSDSKAETA